MSNTRVMGNATTTAAHSAENPAPEAGSVRRTAFVSRQPRWAALVEPFR